MQLFTVFAQFFTVVGQHVKITLTGDHDNITEPYLKKKKRKL